MSPPRCRGLSFCFSRPGQSPWPVDSTHRIFLLIDQKTVEIDALFLFRGIHRCSSIFANALGLNAELFPEYIQQPAANNRKTNNETMKTETQFNKILSSALFRLDGPAVEDLPAELIKLAAELESAEETDWDWDWVECDLASFIVGAYWALTEWHAGQSSASYEAMCSLGAIHSPGLTCGPKTSNPLTLKQKD